MPFADWELEAYETGYTDEPVEGLEGLAMEQAFYPLEFTSTTGNINQITYNRVTGTLFVEFHNDTYRYEDVPEDVADGISDAPSATAYLNANIKGIYDYELL